MAEKFSKTEILTTIRKELNKQYLVYDVQGRVSKTYTAKTDAVQDEPCHIIEYIYYGITNVVKGRKEGYSTWLSSFDGNPAFLVDDLGNQLTDNLGNDLVGA